MCTNLACETYVKPYSVQQWLRRGGEAPRCFDILGAAQINQGAAFVLKLISLGMAAEVIVIFNDQDSCIRPSFLAKKMCGRESTDAATDDNEVVFFSGVGVTRRVVKVNAISHLVSYFE